MEIDREDKYFFQVDLLKAAAIIFVLIDHGFPWEMREGLGIFLWQRMSIPLFMVILGFNAGISFKRKGNSTLKSLYSWNYFKNRFWRYIFPYLVYYLVSVIVGLILFGTIQNMIANLLWDERVLFLGVSPFGGAGIWFIPVLFQSILVIPLLYKGFSGKTYWAILTLILCLLINFITHLLLFRFTGGSIDSNEEWFDVLFYFYFWITMYIWGIGLGMWFSRNHELFSIENAFMWIIAPLAIWYVVLFQFFDFRIPYIRGDYNIIFYTYAAFIFLVVMKLVPKNPKNKVARGIAWIGKSSYHIFLTQMFYYVLMGIIFGSSECLGGTEPLFCIGYLILSIIICCSIGVLWQYIEIRIRKIRKTKKVIIDSSEALNSL